MAINGSTNGHQANGNGNNGKYHARASLNEVSRGYNLGGDGDDDEVFDETESKRTGHTRNDQKDMSRMGKRQELIVSLPFFFLFSSSSFHTHAPLHFFFINEKVPLKTYAHIALSL